MHQKTFEKQTKTTEDQGENQRKVLDPLNFSNKINGWKNGYVLLDD